MIFEYLKYLYMFSSVCMMFYIVKNLDSISISYYFQKSNQEIEEDKSQKGLTIHLMFMVILSPIIFLAILSHKK